MSLKKNILANYASQIYVTCVGILILPLYLKYMGSEAYGLVGFFTMLQAWFSLLDLGLSPTIGRETARYHGGATTTLSYLRLYRALALIFVFIAVIGGVSLWFLSDWIASRWLKSNSLSISDIVIAVKIMAISVALRWLGGLFRGVITGFEKLIWLSVFNVVLVTLRFIGVFVSMWYFGFTTTVFFIHQFIVAVVEACGLLFMSIKLLPSRNDVNDEIGWSLSEIKPVLRFALTLSFTSSVWIFVTQTDKMVLSGILSLADYGHFSLAVLVAGGVLVLASPIFNAVMPRLARLSAEEKSDDLIAVYRSSTKMVSVISVSAALTLVACAHPLLYAWTGDSNLAAEVAPIMRLYAIGNALLSVATFSYYLQYAKGNMQLHLLGSIGMAVFLLPAVIYFSKFYGGIGAGYVWVSVNIVFLFGWVAYVHKKFAPNLHRDWIVCDVFFIAFFAIIITLVIFNFDIQAANRLEGLLITTIVGSLLLGVSWISSKVDQSKLARGICTSIERMTKK